MFEFSFIIIFLNIKFNEIFKSFSYSFFSSLLKYYIFFFFITQKMIRRLIIDRFNIINNFLTEIEDHNIIILSKSNLNDELTEIDTL